MNQFRIGACYRQRNGVVVRLEAINPEAGHDGGKWIRETLRRHQAAVDQVANVVALRGYDCGWRWLHSGKAMGGYVADDYSANLVPGECDPDGNPISEQKAEMIAFDFAADGSETYLYVTAERDPLTGLWRYMPVKQPLRVPRATDPNAAMLARDAAAMQRAKPQQPEQRKPAAKPFPLTISPDLQATSHMVNPCHALAADRG